jgi:hypothetical protein
VKKLASGTINFVVEVSFSCDRIHLGASLAAVLTTSVLGIAVLAHAIETQSHENMRGFAEPLTLTNIVLRVT